MILISNDANEIKFVKTQLHKLFKIKDLGQLKYFLSLEVARSSKEISICQRKYTLELVQSASLLACKPISTPMDPTIKLR